MQDVLASTRKGLFTLRERGGRLQVARHDFEGVPITLAHQDEAGRIYAAANHGHFGPKLHRSDDGGRNWTEIPCPAFPKDAAGTPSLIQIWAFANAGGTLWAGGIPAGLFRSDDRGESWTFVSALWDLPERAKWFGGGYDHPGIHSILVDPRDARHLTLGISCGGVWQSNDSGARWRLTTEGLRAAYMPPEQAADGATQDPHLIAACAAAPDRVWMQHHNGVFISHDGGERWRELTPPVSGFGFAVAAHPDEPDTAWFVPALSDERRYAPEGKMCVQRTRDGGSSFETLRRGLPQENAYDLVYRHALAVAPGGHDLVIGSTSGGLWSSRDAGESWSAAEARLPPVIAVRFIAA